MTTDLKYLAFTAILTASLWIPYVVAQVRTDERSSCSGKLRRSRAPDWCRCGDNVRTRLSQRTGGFCTVCSAGDDRPHHQQGECDDSVLGGVILLAAVGPCRGLSGCYPIPQNGDFHLGLCRIGWNGLGSDQVGANIRVNSGPIATIAQRRWIIPPAPARERWSISPSSWRSRRRRRG
jgi:hypothetical protein